MNSTLTVAFTEAVQLRRGENGESIVEPLQPGARPPITFTKVNDAMHETLASLGGSGADIGTLFAGALQAGGFGGAGAMRGYLARLSRFGCLCYSQHVDGEPFATLLPLSGNFSFNPDAVATDVPQVLSKFTHCHVVDGVMRLRSPLVPAVVQLHAPRAMVAIHALATPCTAAALADAVGIGAEEARQMLVLLANAGAVRSTDQDNPTPEKDDPVLAAWEFEDLLFHAHARCGRQIGPYGRTMPFEGVFEAPPPVKPVMSEDVVRLPKPDVAQFKDDPFTEVLERRRTVRRYGEKPLTFEQLGHFLYRAARLKRLVNPAGVSWRNAPGGGAVHELDLYVSVNQCEGLPFGMYHYNPLKHHLERLNADPNKVRTLLEMGAHMGRLENAPQVLFTYAARFQRVQMRYQSVAYSVMLKNVGCLQQTMYLVAVAMGLAPCALGGGDSDLFAATAGLDYLKETSIGEFLLGSAPAEIPEPLEPPKGMKPIPGNPDLTITYGP